MVGLQSYDNGTKRTWRGSLWNGIDRAIDKQRKELWRIGETIPQKRDMTVLALAGPEDSDRECAIKRGFRNHNIISVDIDDSICRALRQDGKPAICGLLSDVIFSWTSSPIHVVVADFTCGLGKSTDHLIQSLFRSKCVARGCVIAINHLRGRDDGKRAYGWEHTKHRGQLAGFKVARYMVASCQHAGLSVNDQMKFLQPLIDAEFFSYKSGPQFFDSIVFEWVLSPPHASCAESWRKIRHGFTEAGQRVSFSPQKYAARQANLTRLRNTLING